MIDWLTLRMEMGHLDPLVRQRLQARNAYIYRVESTGELSWEVPARESIRSDSHQLTVQIGGQGGYLSLMGSPARIGQTHNVFGSGDIQDCARRMIAWASEALCEPLPTEFFVWRVTRVDVTHNYDLGSLDAVLSALGNLRQSEGGRYQVRTSAESVYWSPSSRLRSGKAYAKGPHLDYMMRKGHGFVDDDQFAKSQNLLRLEFSLRAQFWRERSFKKWWLYTEQELDALHHEFFQPLIGKEVITMNNDLLSQLIEKAPSEGQARSALATWGLIQAQGLRTVENTLSRATWYRHRRILMDAGISLADMHAGKVLPFRVTTVPLREPVRGWGEIRAA